MSALEQLDGDGSVHPCFAFHSPEDVEYAMRVRRVPCWRVACNEGDVQITWEGSYYLVQFAFWSSKVPRGYGPPDPRRMQPEPESAGRLDASMRDRLRHIIREAGWRCTP